LIDYLLFYVPLKNFLLTQRRHHCRWRAAKFRPMLGAQDLWAGKDLYHATPPLTRDISFSGVIRRTAPFCRILHLTTHKGVWQIYSNPGSKTINNPTTYPSLWHFQFLHFHLTIPLLFYLCRNTSIYAFVKKFDVMQNTTKIHVWHH
jgi:hypothetical protein